jgi:probable phosphoglycerate mutase
MTGFNNLVNSWKNNQLDMAIQNGESPNTLVRRQKEAVDYMLQQPDENTVLVCMHGRALRILLCHLTDVPVCKMDDFPHTNTALYVLEYDDGKFTIVDHYNTQHLENL